MCRSRLLHFSLGGAALFAIAPSPTRPDEIHVSAHQKLGVLAKRARLLNKDSLTPEEQRTAIDEWVREELLYREGLRLGLERDDTVVRRRIVQKMQFLFEDMADAANPADEAALTAYYRQHSQRWRTPEAIDFVHVFASESKHGTDARAMALQLLQQLERDPTLDPMTLGEGFIEPRSRTHVRFSTVASSFGEAFAKELFALPVGDYQGPIESSFGWHIVKISKTYGGGVLDFDVVRKQVAAAYRVERRQAEQRKRFVELLRRYAITVDGVAHYRLPIEGIPKDAIDETTK